MMSIMVGSSFNNHAAPTSVEHVWPRVVSTESRGRARTESHMVALSALGEHGVLAESGEPHR